MTKKKIIVGSIGAVVLIIIIVAVVSRNKSGGYQFVAAHRGTITETVSVTGNTTPVKSFDLAFETGGTVAVVYKNAGDIVNAGDALVRLDTSDLAAQLAQAQASVDGAQATLEKLQAGPTPQNLQVSQTALDAAQQTLANTYAGVSDAVTGALAKANDAVRNQIAPFYSNAEGTNPQLTFTISDNQVLNNANFERIQASTELNAWQLEIANVSSASPTSTLTQTLKNATNHLAIIQALLTIDSAAVVDATSLSATTSATYKTDIANAVTEVNSAASAIDTITQNIASENIAVSQAQAQLNVTLAGATPQDIATQQAQVEAAQANTQAIQVKIDKATLIAPTAGIVTVQNAKIGQIASPGQIITSIISNNNLEVDADVPETDIGKVAVGNSVTMTFDAFPGETFSGSVFFIDPAETIISGVVDYKIKVSFEKPDSRIKSGLTANLTINTKTDDNVLILPQYTILQNASGTFVEILQNGTATQIPVSLGIRDQDGNVEIASGVNDGQQVINIGLKTQ